MKMRNYDKEKEINLLWKLQRIKPNFYFFFFFFFFFCICRFYHKYSDTPTPYHICSKIWTSTIHYPMLCLKIAGWVANSVDPDEMPRSAAPHLGLNCLLRPVCPNTYGKYGVLFFCGFFCYSFFFFFFYFRLKKNGEKSQKVTLKSNN